MTITLEVAFSFKHEIGTSTLDLELPAGADVASAIDELVRRFPQLERRLLTTSGAVHRHINALINGENVSFRKGFATTLAQGDRLTLLPPVGGG